MRLRRLVTPILVGVALALPSSGIAATQALAAKAAYAVARPAESTAAAPATANTKPCFYTFPSCSSSNPAVKFTIVSEGDTSGCAFQSTVNWGDKSSVTETYSGGADGSTLATFTHVYSAGRRTYTIVLTSTTTTGDCGIVSTTLYFTLAKLKGKIRLAALGDSYSSGEGAGQYYADTDSTDGCHRSRRAWPLELAKYVTRHNVTVPAEEYFLACSGATSSALTDRFKGEPAQIVSLHDLAPKPGLVTITMGGNDLGFADVLRDCYLFSVSSCDKVIAATEAMLPAEEKALASDYVDVHQADPAAVLLVVGYPQIFEQTSRCYGFSKDAEKALNKLTGKVDDTIADAAGGDGFSYVSDLTALKDHWMCTSDPWVNEVGIWRSYNDDHEQAHPNAAGQEAIARVVAAFIDTSL